MSTKVFVFGTLKRGFPLHAVGLQGAELIGVYRTADAYPMVIAGPWFAPMMFEQRGRGLQVKGELYAVDRQMLARLDALESVGKPGNFRRRLKIEAISSPGTTTLAFVFMKDPRVASPIHSEFLADYQDKRFVPPWSR